MNKKEEKTAEISKREKRYLAVKVGLKEGLHGDSVLALVLLEGGVDDGDVVLNLLARGLDAVVEGEGELGAIGEVGGKDGQGQEDGQDRVGPERELEDRDEDKGSSEDDGSEVEVVEGLEASNLDGEVGVLDAGIVGLLPGCAWLDRGGHLFFVMRGKGGRRGDG